MNDVQQTIAGLRHQGWTLTALADKMGVFRTALGKWVAGQRYPRNARAVLGLLRNLGRPEPDAPVAPAHARDEAQAPVTPAQAQTPVTPSQSRAPVTPVETPPDLRGSFAELQRLLDDDWRQIQAS